jgi:hypothetical protein
MAAVKNYFEYFPKVNFLGRQLVDLTRRATFLRDIKDDYRLVGFYKVKGGETPWGLAHDFYGSEEYDWIILGLNDMVNPLFDWCLSQVELDRLIALKYPGETRYDIHHYVFEDRVYYEPVIFEQRWKPEHGFKGLEIVVPTVVNAQEAAAPENVLNLPATPFRFKVIELNNGNDSISGATEPVWPGGFGQTVVDGDLVWENIGPYTHPESVFVTNQEHEEIENEKKRIIKVLRPRYLANIVSEFDKTMRGVIRR